MQNLLRRTHHRNLWCQPDSHCHTSFPIPRPGSSCPTPQHWSFWAHQYHRFSGFLMFQASPWLWSQTQLGFRGAMANTASVSCGIHRSIEATTESKRTRPRLLCMFAKSLANRLFLIFVVLSHPTRTYTDSLHPRTHVHSPPRRPRWLPGSPCRSPPTVATSTRSEQRRGRRGRT